ncbi:MAG: dihydrofolate reductase [Deltaproteobacteria bacterium]|nr:MAG: dihydrofolate reductase [Deltaproteobacteria bacterium]
MTGSAKKNAIILVVAMTRAGVIGRENRLPWHIPDDLRQFRHLTLGGTLIMGRKTWQSLPAPLHGRHHLVVSKTLAADSGIQIVPSLSEALLEGERRGGPVFLLGGRQIFAEGIARCDLMVVSWIAGDFAGDVTFPAIDWSCWRETARTDHNGFSRSVYRRIAADPP